LAVSESDWSAFLSTVMKFWNGRNRSMKRLHDNVPSRSRNPLPPAVARQWQHDWSIAAANIGSEDSPVRPAKGEWGGTCGSRRPNFDYVAGNYAMVSPRTRLFQSSSFRHMFFAEIGTDQISAITRANGTDFASHGSGFDDGSGSRSCLNVVRFERAVVEATTTAEAELGRDVQNAKQYRTSPLS
jgi:hypothetical protein